MGNYDKIAKLSLDSWVKGFLDSIFSEKTLKTLDELNVEQTEFVQRREDGFFRATFTDGTIVYVHIEVQATNDSEMVWRMADYCLRDYKKYKSEPYQYVLYIGNAALNMENKLSGRKINYEYELIDIRDLSPDFFLGGKDWRFWTLTYLTARDLETRNALLETIIHRLIAAGLSKHQFTEALTILAELAPLRNAQTLVYQKIKEMTLEIPYDVREMPFYQDGLLEGEAKGEAKGRAEGAAEKRDEMIRNLAKNGVSIEIIAKTADLDVETVQKIING